MAGVQVPLVLLPRYTTYVAEGGYTTIGMDISAYRRASISVWRNAMIGSSSPTFKFTFEESMDQVNWSTCADTSADNELSDGEEKVFAPSFAKRWFRIRVVLNGTSPGVTCWAVGFLEERET